ncbi:unnamed protein product [Caenorhabditis auriculariae]|uniref:C2H2-type domain-containing protein n=1 Tax=Caenorhabditis auriculariae TaxID=2777116 RepID=A0A8S1GSN7_9PELO|nr:unnamed protein product [Caenorhabditis auriculariae]
MVEDRFVGRQNLVPVLTGPVEMLLRPLHPGDSILFRNQRRRFTVETDGGDGEFEKTSRLIAGAVSLGLVLGVFKMFLSPLRSLKRGLPELRNARLCHAEHSRQRHHGQSILTTHNDGSFVSPEDKVDAKEISNAAVRNKLTKILPRIRTKPRQLYSRVILNAVEQLSAVKYSSGGYQRFLSNIDDNCANVIRELFRGKFKEPSNQIHLLPQVLRHAWNLMPLRYRSQWERENRVLLKTETENTQTFNDWTWDECVTMLDKQDKNHYIHVCGTDSYVIKSFVDVKSHFTTHHEQLSIYCCHFCMKVFADLKGLYSHKNCEKFTELKHQKQTKKEELLSMALTFLACSDCGLWIPIWGETTNPNAWRFFVSTMKYHSCRNLVLIFLFFAEELDVLKINDMKLDFSIVAQTGVPFESGCQICEIESFDCYESMEAHFLNRHPKSENHCKENHFFSNIIFPPALALANFLQYQAVLETLTPKKVASKLVEPLEDVTNQKLLNCVEMHEHWKDLNERPNSEKISRPDLGYEFADYSEVEKEVEKKEAAENRKKQAKRLFSRVVEGGNRRFNISVVKSSAIVVSLPMGHTFDPYEDSDSLLAFRRYMYCKKCEIVFSCFEDEHFHGCAAGKESLRTLYHPSSNVFTGIACVVESCKHRSCSLLGLKHHSLVEHNLSIRLDAQINSESSFASSLSKLSKWYWENDIEDRTSMSIFTDMKLEMPPSGLLERIDSEVRVNVNLLEETIDTRQVVTPPPPEFDDGFFVKDRKYFCQFCNEPSATRATVSRHLSICHCYPCPCGKAFATFELLTQHRIHCSEIEVSQIYASCPKCNIVKSRGLLIDAYRHIVRCHEVKFGKGDGQIFPEAADIGTESVAPGDTRIADPYYRPKNVLIKTPSTTDSYDDNSTMAQLNRFLAGIPTDGAPVEGEITDVAPKNLRDILRATEVPSPEPEPSSDAPITLTDILRATEAPISAEQHPTLSSLLASSEGPILPSTLETPVLTTSPGVSETPDRTIKTSPAFDEITDPVLQLPAAFGRIPVGAPVIYYLPEDNSGFTCYLCEVQFKDERALQTHMEKHTEQCKVCPMCSAQVTGRADMLKHLMSFHHDPKNSTCKTCYRIVEARSAPAHFIYACKMAVRCGICRVMVDPSNRDDHMATHQKIVKRFDCPQCGDYFPTALEAGRHGCSFKVYHCPCGEYTRYHSQRAFEAHYFKMHTGPEMECKLCSIGKPNRRYRFCASETRPCTTFPKSSTSWGRSESGTQRSHQLRKKRSQSIQLKRNHSLYLYLFHLAQAPLEMETARMKMKSKSLLLSAEVSINPFLDVPSNPEMAENYCGVPLDKLGYLCVHCRMFFAMKADFEAHKNGSLHKSRKALAAKFENSGFYCGVCPVKYDNLMLLCMHELFDHGVPVISYCSACCAGSTNINMTYDHILSHGTRQIKTAIKFVSALTIRYLRNSYSNPNEKRSVYLDCGHDYESGASMHVSCSKCFHAIPVSSSRPPHELANFWRELKNYSHVAVDEFNKLFAWAHMLEGKRRKHMESILKTSSPWLLQNGSHLPAVFLNIDPQKLRFGSNPPNIPVHYYSGGRQEEVKPINFRSALPAQRMTKRTPIPPPRSNPADPMSPMRKLVPRTPVNNAPPHNIPNGRIPVLIQCPISLKDVNFERLVPAQRIRADTGLPPIPVLPKQTPVRALPSAVHHVPRQPGGLAPLLPRLLPGQPMPTPPPPVVVTRQTIRPPQRIQRAAVPSPRAPENVSDEVALNRLVNNNTIHVESHTVDPDKKWFCGKCSQQFFSTSPKSSFIISRLTFLSQLRTHRVWPVKFLLKCPVPDCKIEFHSLKDFNLHFRYIHDEPLPHRVPSCGTGFATPELAQKHEKEHADCVESTRFEQQCCPLCGTFETWAVPYKIPGTIRSIVLSHIHSHAFRHLSRCCCARRFIDDHDFVVCLEHFINEHTIIDGEKYYCILCKLTVQNKDELKIHCSKIHFAHVLFDITEKLPLVVQTPTTMKKFLGI